MLDPEFYEGFRKLWERESFHPEDYKDNALGLYLIYTEKMIPELICYLSDVRQGFQVLKGSWRQNIGLSNG